MVSTLLINHIEVGKIITEDSNIIAPRLETFISGSGFDVILTGYSYDTIEDRVEILYLLKEYSNSGFCTKSFHIFNSDDVKTKEWNEYYQLTEL